MKFGAKLATAALLAAGTIVTVPATAAPLSAPMGLTNNAALFERLGYTPGMFWGTLVGCTELVGGILLVLGLFTRFAAAAVLIFMIVAVKFTSAKGFFWSAGGYEYPLLIGICALFFLIRGGGPLSLDRTIGREI